MAWKRIGGVLGVGFTLLQVGCTSTGTVEISQADIRGVITSAQKFDAQSASQGKIGSLLIEGVNEADTRYDKASVRITDQTRILSQSGNVMSPTTFEELRVGQRVQATFTGSVLQTYPVQATADEVVLLKPTPL